MSVTLIAPPFAQLTGQRLPLKVVDVGANPIDSEPPYAPLMASDLTWVVGFEPNQEALGRLNEKKGPRELYLPHAVGDGKRHPLNFCQAPGMTSILEPNPAVLNLFHGFPNWGRVTSTVEVDTVRLDDVPETAGVDMLKMDIQGAEWLVLSHAKERLKDALVVQLEVEFLPLYKDQPLFAEVDQLMRQHGFMLHRLLPLVSRVVQPLLVDNNIYAGMSQTVWTDAVFIRDLTRLDLLNDRQLLATASILHDCYQSMDVALHLLTEMDRRNGSQLGPNYLQSLMQTARRVDPGAPVG
ncbi:MAG: FkbM family methyltransferase [Magnetococcales bacterium]|nr:FkbM family methyltransferase [Magnetococcales bacterium]